MSCQWFYPSVWLILAAFWADPREFFVCLSFNDTPQLDRSVGHAQLTSIAPSQLYKRSIKCNSLGFRALLRSLSQMTLLLLFVLVLTHRLTQLVQANYTVALPLSVRSPYFSCWLPQINGSEPSMGRFSEYYQGTTTSNLSQVRAFPSIDVPELRYTSLF